MLLTKKLLSFIGRVFDKDPRKFLALRLGYDGGMTWRVEDATLYTTVQGGSGQDLEVDLGQHTVTGLVNHLANQPGYAVQYIDGSELAQLSARVLLDGAGDISRSNGDHLYGYSNVLWAFLETTANELEQAKTAIAEMLRQLSTKTASDMWLDELGDQYGVLRMLGELDQQYGPRIIAEVLRPRENNIAMEAAIRIFTGQQAKVTDVVEWTIALPAHDSSITHNGASTYSSSASPLYGLFDVQYGYDLLNGGDFTEFQQTVRELIDRLRAAGTHLRALALQGSAIGDTFTAPTDASGAKLLNVNMAMGDDFAGAVDGEITIAMALEDMNDSLDPATDDAALSIQYNLTHNSIRSYNGAVQHRGTDLVPEPL